MKNSISTKIYYLFRVFTSICFLILLLISCFGIVYTVTNAKPKQVTELSGVWTDEAGNAFSLNSFQKTNSKATPGKKIYYTISNIPNDTIIMFRCRNMFVNVYIDNEMIYEDDQTLHPIFGSSPGSRWHSIALDSSLQARTICLEGFPCYTDSDGLIDNIYFGHTSNVYKTIISNHFLSFTTSCFLLLISIILLILCFAFRSRKSMSLDLLYLGLGIFCASFWAVTESLLYQLFFAHSEVIHLITYTSLISIPLPFALLAAHRLDGWIKRIANIYAMCNCLNICITSFLHITGIREYHYILTPTHILLALTIPLLILLILSYVDYKENANKTKYLIIPVITFIAVCLTVALIEYLLGWFDSYSNYTQLAMISFLSCLVFYHVHQMIDVLQKGMQADMLHKLALTDYLTGLYNRTAFAEHKANYLEKIVNDCVLGVIQLDVNNLKKVNDTLGHEKGDQLIQLVAEGLKTSFSQYGNCYRMGGDEFLVILNGNNPQTDYESGIMQLNEYCDAHNQKPDIEFQVQIAHGFVLDYNISLSEALEKADILMYENKRMLKEKSI